MSVKTNEMIENFETENLMDNPDYRAFYKRHMKKLERQRPLCRVTESIKPAIEQDYWKLAVAKAMAEMGTR
jgi:hypothetical protein